MKRRRAIVLTTVMFAASLHPGVAFAQDDDLARVREAYDANTLADLERVIGAAEAEGVPRSLLTEKAIEGAAKRADAATLVDAVSTWADELNGAVVLLGRGTEPAGLAKAAESIRHGVEPRVVSNLAGDYPADYPIMLQAIEDLVHSGVEIDEAQSMVIDAAEQGFDGEDMLTMSATLRRMVRDGSSPVDAAASLRTNFRAGRTGGVTIPPPPPPTEASRSRTGAPLPVPSSPLPSPL